MLTGWDFPGAENCRLYGHSFKRRAQDVYYGTKFRRFDQVFATLCSRLDTKKRVRHDERQITIISQKTKTLFDEKEVEIDFIRIEAVVLSRIVLQ